MFQLYLSPAVANISVESRVDEDTFQLAERGQTAVSVQGVSTARRVIELSPDISRGEPNLYGDRS